MGLWQTSPIRPNRYKLESFYVSWHTHTYTWIVQTFGHVLRCDMQDFANCFMHVDYMSSYYWETVYMYIYMYCSICGDAQYIGTISVILKIGQLKGIVHPKMKILSLITHPHVVPNLKDLCSSSEHKLRYFWWNPRVFWHCIDSNITDTFKAQKGSKDIVKIVHVTSVVQP